MALGQNGFGDGLPADLDPADVFEKFAAGEGDYALRRQGGQTRLKTLDRLRRMNWPDEGNGLPPVGNHDLLALSGSLQILCQPVLQFSYADGRHTLTLTSLWRL